LRAWAAALGAEAEGRFEYVEVEGAGHFWVERGVKARLCEAVTEWALRCTA
jgi:hypothetical protein